MSKKEVEEIVLELKSAPETFNLAVKLYNTMKNGSDRAELGKAIREAKEAMTLLDITLEDIQIDLEYEYIKQQGHY